MRLVFTACCLAFAVAAACLALLDALAVRAAVVAGEPISYRPPGEWFSYRWVPFKKVADGWHLRRTDDPEDVIVVAEADLLR